MARQSSSASLLVADPSAGAVYVLGSGKMGARKRQQSYQFVRKKTAAGWEEPVLLPQSMIAFNAAELDSGGQLHLTGSITDAAGVSHWKSVMWTATGQWLQTDLPGDLPAGSRGTCLVRHGTGTLYAAGTTSDSLGRYYWMTRKLDP